MLMDLTMSLLLNSVAVSVLSRYGNQNWSKRSEAFAARGRHLGGIWIFFLSFER